MCAAKRTRSDALIAPSRYSVTSSTNSWQVTAGTVSESGTTENCLTSGRSVSSLGREVGLERGPHARPGAVQDHALVALREAEGLAHLVRAEAVDVAQRDHRPLHIGEPVDLGPDPRAGLAIQRDLRRIETPRPHRA